MNKDNTILLLKESHVEWFSKRFDEAFDFKEIIPNKVVGSAIEAVDDKGAKISLNFSNKRVSVYIPDEYKDELHIALDDIIDGDKDYTEAVEKGIDVINQITIKLEINPYLKSIAKSVLELAKAALFIYMDKKLSEEEEEAS